MRCLCAKKKSLRHCALMCVELNRLHKQPKKKKRSRCSTTAKGTMDALPTMASCLRWRFGNRGSPVKQTLIFPGVRSKRFCECKNSRIQTCCAVAMKAAYLEGSRRPERQLGQIGLLGSVHSIDHSTPFTVSWVARFCPNMLNRTITNDKIWT